MSLEQPLGGGGGQDDLGAQQLLLLLVESLQGGESGEGTQVGEGEWMISRHPQVTRHVLVITAVTILEQENNVTITDLDLELTLSSIYHQDSALKYFSDKRHSDYFPNIPPASQHSSPVSEDVLISSERCLARQLLPDFTPCGFVVLLVGQHQTNESNPPFPPYEQPSN